MEKERVEKELVEKERVEEELVEIHRRSRIAKRKVPLSLRFSLAAWRLQRIASAARVSDGREKALDLVFGLTTLESRETANVTPLLSAGRQVATANDGDVLLMKPVHRDRDHHHGRQ